MNHGEGKWFICHSQDDELPVDQEEAQRLKDENVALTARLAKIKELLP